jgi:hypothetical protein
VSFAFANPFMMGWYYVSLGASYTVLGALGAGRIAAAIAPRGGRAVAALAQAGLFMALAAPPGVRYDRGGARGGEWPALQSEWEKDREREYLAVGTDVQAATLGRATVAAPEIGALGHAYHGPILDTMGLVTPSALRYHPVPREQVAGNAAIPPSLIIDAAPDAVVFLEIFGRRGLLLDPRFTRDYRLWRRYPSHVFGSRGLLVYVRRTAPW